MSGNLPSGTRPAAAGGTGTAPMLRGSDSRAARRVRASIVATTIVSVRRPYRPGPASPPSSSTVTRPPGGQSWAAAAAAWAFSASALSACTPSEPVDLNGSPGGTSAGSTSAKIVVTAS
jgi:hypothetical protein